MSKRTFDRKRLALREALLGAAALCAATALWTSGAAAQTPAGGKIPNLESITFAWLANGVHWFDPPAGMGRGPIKQDPAFPYHGNVDGPGQVTPDIGFTKDPVLKPWAAKQMQESNDEVLSGKRGLPFVAQSTCHPGGVPGQLLTPAEPFYFIQTPKEVWMIWQRDHMVRRIYMTDRHSEVVKPSWFGESIGRYEADGTLVVDTVGLSTHNSFLDWYRPALEPYRGRCRAGQRLPCWLQTSFEFGLLRGCKWRANGLAERRRRAGKAEGAGRLPLCSGGTSEAFQHTRNTPFVAKRLEHSHALPVERLRHFVVLLVPSQVSQVSK